MSVPPSQDKACHRQRYAQRKAAGLCPYCGTQPPHTGYAACIACRKRFRVYSERYVHKKREMRRQGLKYVYCQCRKRALILCTRCQAPLCDTCYDLGEGCCQDCLVLEP